MDVNFLFVYGRLREYYVDEEIFDVESLVTLPGKTKGTLFEYEQEAVLVEQGKDDYVYGNLVIATDINILLRHTDGFMEFDENDYSNSKYIRIMKEVIIESLNETIKTWCYVYPSSRLYDLQKNGQVIESGNWLEYIELAGKKNVKK